MIESQNCNDKFIFRNRLSFIAVVSVFVVFCFLSISTAWAFVNSTHDTTVNYFKKGKNEADRGNFEKALEIWEQAYNELSVPDFRIGQSYIELVTSKDFKDRYKKASQIYFWSISGNRIRPEIKSNLIRELEYLDSIIGYGTYKELKNKVEDNDPSVYKDLYKIWKDLDPTPLTKYNERLIEHWERIDYCNKHFASNSSKKIDGRANVYIRYGKPYFKKKGMLVYNSLFANKLIKDRIRANMINSSRFQQESAEMLSFNLETKVRQLHENPNYEVWIYENLTDNLQDIVFLFGSSDGTNEFKKLKSVEEFIPNSAFRKLETNLFVTNFSQQSSQLDNENSGNDNTNSDNIRSLNSIGNAQTPDVDITPALILQIMYYRQLSSLDPYFGSSYDYMLNRYSNLTRRISRSLAREFENKNSGELIHIERQAPVEKSTYADEMRNIPIHKYTYRFLDENNTPYAKIFIVSNPNQAIFYNQLKINNSLSENSWSRFRLRNGVVVMDKITNQDYEIYEDYINLTSGMTNRISSVFDIKYIDDHLNLIAGAYLEILDKNKSKTTQVNDVFDPSIGGIGKTEFSVPPPLHTNQLELSDIILGYVSSDSSNMASANTDFSFNISHERNIPAGKNLHLYFELYNLKTDPDNKGKFKFSYEIKKKNKGLGNIFNRGDKSLSITLNIESLEEQYNQVLEIETTSFETGSYDLNIHVEDLKSGETLKRGLEFTIR